MYEQRVRHITHEVNVQDAANRASFACMANGLPKTESVTFERCEKKGWSVTSHRRGRTLKVYVLWEHSYLFASSGKRSVRSLNVAGLMLSERLELIKKLDELTTAARAYGGGEVTAGC